jgi:hypothetical protein
MPWIKDYKVVITASAFGQAPGNILHTRTWLIAAIPGDAETVAK